jgi:hypothetical protein
MPYGNPNGLLYSRRVSEINFSSAKSPLAQPRHPGEAATEVGLDKLVEVLKWPDLVAHEPLATTKQSVGAQSLWPLGLLLFSVRMPNAQAKQCIAATPSNPHARL